MTPSLDKRQQCSTFSSVIAIKGTIPQTLLIRIDTKTISRWERCFNIAWSFLYIYIYISISIYFILKLYVHVIRTDEVWMYDNGWVQENKTKQYNTELLKQGCLCSQSPSEQRAWHPAQNKPAWMLRGVWTTEIAPFPHPSCPSRWQISPAAHSKGSVSDHCPFCPHVPSRWTRLELQHAFPKTGMLP